MLKILKTLRFILLLPLSLSAGFGFFGTLWLAMRIARTDRARAAWLLLRLATFIRRMPGSRAKSRSDLGALVALAHLLQGAPWKQVRRLFQPGSVMAQMGFQFYFADQRFDQALEAAEGWCEQTESAVADCADEMRAFFEHHGDDLSREAITELWMQHNRDQEAAWEADPQGKPRGFDRFFKPTAPRFPRFLAYYKAHLARGATRWVATRDLNSLPLKCAFESEKTHDIESMGLLQFHVSTDSLKSLGITPGELAELHREAMGQ